MSTRKTGAFILSGTSNLEIHEQGFGGVGVCTVPFLREPSREEGIFFLRDKGGLYREVTLELIP